MTGILAKVAGKLRELFDRGLEATAPATPSRVLASVEERGHILYAVVRCGEHEARERLPREILKWPNARASAYLDEVKDRLIAKVGLVSKDQPPPASPALSRRGRRAARARRPR